MLSPCPCFLNSGGSQELEEPKTNLGAFWLDGLLNEFVTKDTSRLGASWTLLRGGPVRMGEQERPLTERIGDGGTGTPGYVSTKAVMVPCDSQGDGA